MCKKEITAITARGGRALWRMREPGPRGGCETFYAERKSNASAPSGFELWSRTQKGAGGFAAPAGAFPHAGYYGR